MGGHNVTTRGMIKVRRRLMNVCLSMSPPQVMMMVLPLLIIVLLPKVVNTNDPEMRKVKETSWSLSL